MSSESPAFPIRETPSAALARKIIDGLLAANLISTPKKDEIAKKIAHGNATTADWRLWAEIALDEATRTSSESIGQIDIEDGANENTN